MGLGSLLTGLAIYKPVQFAWLTTVLGGYKWARFEHLALTVGYVLFFIVHITQVIRAGWTGSRIKHGQLAGLGDTRLHS